MKITLLGATPSKKNSRTLFWRNGRQVNLPSNKYLAWEEDCLLQLLAYKGQAEGKVTIDYYFWVKDNRARDLDNMIASVNDVLVKSGLLVDDSWQHLAIGSADAAIDKLSPRAELLITQKAAGS